MTDDPGLFLHLFNDLDTNVKECLLIMFGDDIIMGDLTNICEENNAD